MKIALRFLAGTEGVRKPKLRFGDGAACRRFQFFLDISDLKY
jgi:hypothetical protein